MFRRMLASILLGSMLVLTAAGMAAANARFLLGFAESYTAPDGTVRVHRGVDIAVPEGGRVQTPLSGEVGFVGRVPGPHGGTVLAVTVVDGDRKLTFMPLEAASVSQGERIAQGESVGTVAPQDDPSSAAPHVHVSLRKEGVYIDPSDLFAEAPAVPAPAPADPGADVPRSAGTPVESPAVPVAVPGAPAPTPAAAVAGAPVPGVSPVAGGAPLTVSTGVKETRPLESGGAELAPGVSVVAGRPSRGAAVVPVAGAVEAATLAAQASSADRLWSSIGQAATTVAGQPLGVASCLAAFVGCIALFTRRALVRRLISEEPVSDRLGKMLRALRAGDTLCGLTSCSGHSAFTDPGPL